MTENPCRYCTDRDPYCHGRCQKYKDWQAVHKAEKAAMAKDRAKYAWSYAQKRSYWANICRDPYKNCAKKFKD